MTPGSRSGKVAAMSEARPKVLFVDHVSKVLGGAEVNLVELLAHAPLAERWEIVTACSSGSPLDQALAKLGVAREPYGFPPALNELRVVGRRFNPMAKLRAVRELQRVTRRLSDIVQRTRPDVVLSVTNKDHFAAGAAARAAGIPSLWWVNDILSGDFFGWAVRRAFVSRARKLATRLVPVSNHGREALIREGVPADRVVRIHNGIPLHRYARTTDGGLRHELKADSGEPLIGVIGRITPWKGQDFFVRLAAAWKARGRAGRFVIIGRAFNEDGPFEQRVRSHAHELGVDDRVHFVPFQSDINAALSSLDVLLHTSLKPEPFGRVLIEAMAVGVPVIAARAGGVPEIITSGEDGELAAPGDEPGYVAALDRVLTDSERRARLVGAARRTVEQRFTVERVVEDFDALIRSVVRPC
jgi:glycosyltransferase involved in cell wall biosynthesis